MRRPGKTRTKLIRAAARPYIAEPLEPRRLLSAINWINLKGGDWAIPSNWSGGKVPVAADDVTINVPGNVVITHSQGSNSVNSITTDDAITLSGGTITVGSFVNLNGVTLALAGGTLTGATINSTGAGAVSVTNNNSDLNGVTLNANLTMPMFTLSVQSGLTLSNGATVALNSLNDITGPTLIFLGTQSLGGNGTVAMGGSRFGSPQIYAQGNGGNTPAMLTIGPGVTIDQLAGASNIADIDGRFPGDALVNFGTIEANVSGRAFNIGNGLGPVTNDGTMEAMSGAALTIINLQNQPGQALSAAGSTLTLGGIWNNAGIISATNSTLNLGGFFSPSAVGTMENSGSTVNITGELMLTPVPGLQAQFFSGTNFQTLLLTRIDSTIDYSYGYTAPDILVGGNVPTTNFSAIWTGELSVPTSGAYTFYTNTDDGDRLYINGQELINNFTSVKEFNSASITLNAGAEYPFEMDFFQGGGPYLVQIQWSGPSIPEQMIPATAFSLLGAAGPSPSDLTLNDQTGSWNLAGGTIVGGTINTNGAAVLNVTAASTLDGVTMNGNLDIDSGQLSVEGGLTLENGASVVLNSPASGSSHPPNISFVGTQTIGGNGAVVFGGHSNPGSISVANGTLTIASGITITSSSLAGAVNGSGPIINQGAVQAAGGQTLTVSNAFTEQGTIGAVGGSALVLANLQTPAGTIPLTAGNSITLGGNYTLDQGATIPAGATLTLNGTWSNPSTIDLEGGTINLGGSFTLAELGTFNRVGGTVNLTGSLYLAPAAPTNLAVGMGGSDAILTWMDNASDESGYEIERSTDGVNFEQIGIVSANTTVYYDAGLSAGTTYYYRVAAYFSVGLSPYSNIAVSTTTLDGREPGILAQYFSDNQFQTPLFSRDDANLDYSYGYDAYPYVPISDNFQVNNFSAIWTGQISVPATGQYTFYTESDDGVRLFVNGQQLVNDFTDHYATQDSGTITLNAGQEYTFEMDFFQDGGGYLAQLEWSSSSMIQEVIPVSAFDLPVGVAPNYPANTPGPVISESGIGMLALNDTTDSWNLNGGTIVGGLVTTSGGATLNFTGSSALDGVSLETNLNIPFGKLNIYDGLTLLNGTTITVDGQSKSMFGNPGLEFVGTQTLQGDGAVLLEGGYSTGSIGVKYGTVTFGPDVPISIEGDGPGCSFNFYDAGNIINETTIQIAAGQNLTVNTGFTNLGLIELPSDSAITFNGDTHLNQDLTVPTGATLTFNKTWHNAATIHLDDGTVNLGGSFTLADLGNLARAGGVVNLTGSINLGPPGVGTGALLLDDNTGTWNLPGGTIVGGLVNTSGSASLNFSGTGTLDGVTLDSNLSIPGGQLTVLDGLTLDGGNVITLDCRLSNINGPPTIDFVGDQTLTGGGVILLEGSSSAASINSARGNLVIGPGISISLLDGSSLVLNGSYNLELEFTVPTNTTLTLDGAWNNSSVLDLEGGTINLGGVITPASLGTFIRNGGTVNVVGDLYLTQSFKRLNAQFFSGTDFQTPLLTRVDSNIDYSYGYSGYSGAEIPDNPIGGGVPIYEFSAIWAGYILAPTTGQYTFYTQTDDGVRLFVNGTELINDFTIHPQLGDSGSITLTAGVEYPIEMDYFQGTGPYLAQLYWSGPSVPVQIIPASAFLVPDGTFTPGPVALNLNDSTGSWNLAGGTIVGGTINTSGNASLNVTGSGTLFGTALNGNLNIQNGQLTVLDGLTLNNGATIALNAQSPDASDAPGIQFNGIQTLAGNGSVLFSGSYSNGSIGVANGPLTIASGITITNYGADGSIADDGVGAIINLGAIQASGGHSLKIDNPLTDQGTIGASAGSTLVVSNIPTTAGNLSLAGGGSISLDGYYALDQGVTIPAGASLTLDGYWSNPSTIDLEGGTINLGGSFLPADLGTFVRNGGTVNLTGTLNAAPSFLGLKAQYFSGTNFQTPLLTRVDAAVDYSYGYMGNDGMNTPDMLVGGNVPLSNFSAIWTGLISVPVTGQYTFYTQSDDGVRVFVNGQEVVNDFVVQGTMPDSGKITLNSGQEYSIEMDYFQATGQYQAQLYWSGPTFAQQIIPESALLVGYLNGVTSTESLVLNDLAGSWNLSGGTIIGGTVNTSGNASLNVVGTGTLDGVTLDGNTIIQSGQLTVLNGLTSENGAALDVNTGSVAVDYGVGNPSPLSSVQAYLASGALFSSAAQATPGSALGYVDGTIDSGTAAQPGQLLIKYTLAGDANLDGAVNFQDLVAVVQNFNKPGTDWAQGNFGGVASTEMNDLAIVFQNFNKTLSPPAASSAVQNGGSTLLTTGGGSTPLATVTTIPLAQSASVQVQPKPSPAVASRGYQIPTLPPAAAPLSDPEAEILQSGEATQTILAN